MKIEYQVTSNGGGRDAAGRVNGTFFEFAANEAGGFLRVNPTQHFGDVFVSGQLATDPYTDREGWELEAHRLMLSLLLSWQLSVESARRERERLEQVYDQQGAAW
jgi:hypothetical protein